MQNVLTKHRQGTALLVCALNYYETTLGHPRKKLFAVNRLLILMFNFSFTDMLKRH